jgi:hypothetical protein
MRPRTDRLAIGVHIVVQSRGYQQADLLAGVIIGPSVRHPQINQASADQGGGDAVVLSGWRPELIADSGPVER